MPKKGKIKKSWKKIWIKHSTLTDLKMSSKIPELIRKRKKANALSYRKKANIPVEKPESLKLKEYNDKELEDEFDDFAEPDYQKAYEYG
jgi:hypothetical protein